VEHSDLREVRDYITETIHRWRVVSASGSDIAEACSPPSYGQNIRKCCFGRSSDIVAHAQLPSAVWLYHHNPLLRLGGTPFRSDCFLIT